MMPNGLRSMAALLVVLVAAAGCGAKPNPVRDDLRAYLANPQLWDALTTYAGLYSSFNRYKASVAAETAGLDKRKADSVLNRLHREWKKEPVPAKAELLHRTAPIKPATPEVQAINEYFNYKATHLFQGIVFDTDIPQLEDRVNDIPYTLAGFHGKVVGYARANGMEEDLPAFEAKWKALPPTTAAEN